MDEVKHTLHRAEAAQRRYRDELARLKMRVLSSEGAQPDSRPASVVIEGGGAPQQLEAWLAANERLLCFLAGLGPRAANGREEGN